MLIEVDVESLRAAMDGVKTGRKDPNYDPNMAMDGLLDLLTDIVEADVVVDNAAELRTEVTNLAATNTTLRAEGANLLAEVTSLRTTNAALAASVNTLTAAGPALGAPNQGTKLLKPEPFSGERAKLRPFLRQLRVNCSIISDEQARLRYAFALLRGSALDQVLPYVRNNRVDLANLDALTTILETAFGDPNQRRNAERKLHTLRIGTKDFASYYTKFQRYATDTN